VLRLRGVFALALGETIAWGVLYYVFGALLSREPSLATGLSLALFASALAAPLVGRAIGRFGPRNVMVTGAAIAVLALLALATGRSLAAFAALGVAQAMTLYEPAFAAVVAWYPDAPRRRRALVIVTVAGAFAGPIFLPAAMWMFDRGGWPGTMAAGALALVVVTASFASMPDGGAATAPEPPRKLAERRADPALVVVFAAQSFVATGVMLHLTARVGMLAALAGLAQIAGRLFLAALPAETSTRSRVAALLALQAIAIVLLGPAPAAGVLLFGATNGALTIERPLVVVEWVGEGRHVSAAARIAAVASVARAAAPATVAALAAWTTHDFAFLTLAAGLFLAAFTFSASFPPASRLWRRGPRDC
jgi:hypothetical protein